MGSECFCLEASQWRQGRRLTGIELHVEGDEKCRCAGIIAHQRDEIDELATAELFQASSEGHRRHSPCPEDLTPESDHNRVCLVEAAGIFAVPDDLYELLGDTLADRLWLVSRPFKLAVEFTGDGENGQFADPVPSPASYRI